MKVKINNKVSVLSRPDGSPARIVNIAAADSSQTSRQNTDSVYTYELFFNADLRNAINSSYFNVRLCVRRKNKENKVQFLGDLKDSSAKKVHACLYGKSKDNKDKLLFKNRSSLIFSKMIDLSSYIDNS